MLERNKVYKPDKFPVVMRYVGFGDDGRRYFELLYRKTNNEWVIIDTSDGVKWNSPLWGKIQDTPVLTGSYWGFNQNEIDGIVFEECTKVIQINTEIIPVKLKTKFIME